MVRNLKKHEVICPLGPKKLITTTTVTTDKMIIKKWFWEEKKSKMISFNINTKFPTEGGDFLNILVILEGIRVDFSIFKS